MKLMKVDALVFDLYGTLFDVFSVTETCRSLFGEKGPKVSERWRQKQLEYAFLRQVMKKYVPFDVITKQALRYACRFEQVELTPEAEKELLNQYERLTPFPEVKETLAALSNKTRAIFSNGPASMLTPLLAHAGFEVYFDEVISVDEIKQYKPSPMVYQHVVHRLGVGREHILFMSANAWDIAGAKNFGFQTVWVNRAGLPFDELDVEPDYVVDDLSSIPTLLRK
jgi:2-haloacid dehalogenase